MIQLTDDEHEAYGAMIHRAKVEAAASALVVGAGDKFTGDYHIFGEVRGVFTMASGAVRYAVEHKAEGGGSFLHVYSEANLQARNPA